MDQLEALFKPQPKKQSNPDDDNIYSIFLNKKPPEKTSKPKPTNPQNTTIKQPPVIQYQVPNHLEKLKKSRVEAFRSKQEERYHENFQRAKIQISSSKTSHKSYGPKVEDVSHMFKKAQSEKDKTMRQREKGRGQQRKREQQQKREQQPKRELSQKKSFEDKRKKQRNQQEQQGRRMQQAKILEKQKHRQKEKYKGKGQLLKKDQRQFERSREKPREKNKEKLRKKHKQIARERSNPIAESKKKTTERRISSSSQSSSSYSSSSPSSSSMSNSEEQAQRELDKMLRTKQRKKRYKIMDMMPIYQSDARTIMRQQNFSRKMGQRQQKLQLLREMREQQRRKKKQYKGH